MRHVAAYLLCALGGKESPSVDDIEKVITSFGGDADTEKIQLLLKELEGENIDEVIQAGKKKLAGVALGGSNGASKSAAPQDSAAPVVEAVEEEDADIDASKMFGDDDY